MDRMRRGLAATGVDPDRVVWRKSLRSSGDGSNCVEVADLDDVIGVRDSKAPAAGHLAFPAGTWRAFATAVKSGRYDLS